MTCTWEPDIACLGDKWETYSPEVQEQSLLLASSALQMLTNYRVGTCPITIRPCAETPRCGCGWSPYIRDGVWRNECSHNSACTPLVEIDIPGPVGYIDSLKIDGVEQALWDGDWRLDNGHLLVWQGEGTSPVLAFQNLNLADTEVGTWSLTYSQSYPVSREGRLAVAALALEFAEACKPRGKCSLPRGVRTVSRMGVSFTLEAGLFPNGLTGLDTVDSFILKWAPAGSPTRSASVYDPSKKSPRRVSAVPARPVSGSN